MIAVRCVRRIEIVESAGPHLCFWADEHVHTAGGLMGYRYAITCAHGYSIKFKHYLKQDGSKPGSSKEAEGVEK